MKTKKERNFVTIGDNFCHYLWRVGANFHNFQTFKKIRQSSNLNWSWLYPTLYQFSIQILSASPAFRDTKDTQMH